MGEREASGVNCCIISQCPREEGGITMFSLDKPLPIQNLVAEVVWWGQCGGLCKCLLKKWTEKILRSDML